MNRTTVAAWAAALAVYAAGSASGMINVLEYGAKGDGITDDTAAIQRAIDDTAARGGGKIYFPYTPPSPGTNPGARTNSPSKVPNTSR